MALGYGAILADDGRLQVGPTALTSGVRLPPDEYADFAVTAEGLVEPRTGGISVAPAWRRLPVHRLLRRLRGQFPRAVGKNALFRWRLGDAVFAEGPLGRGRLEPTRSCDSAPDTRAQASAGPPAGRLMRWRAASTPGGWPRSAMGSVSGIRVSPAIGKNKPTPVPCRPKLLRCVGPPRAEESGFGAQVSETIVDPENWTTS